MSKKNKSLLWVGLLLLIITFSFSATNAEAKFPAKNISFIVPVTPGGGFDTATRMLVPFLEKYLPGHPNVIVKNVPGGEWSIGINKMYRSKPDGNTVCIFNMPGNATSQVLGKAKYDLNKVTWIGNISEVVYVTALSKTSKYKSLKELQDAPEVTSGVVGLASTAGLGTIIAAERMGIKMKPIPTDGSVQAILAAIRGDVDWVQYPIETLKKSIVDSQDLTPVWVYSKKRLDLLPDVPTIAELGYKDLLDIVAMTRPVGAPPGLPKDVLKVWEDSFSKAVNDPEFQQKMIKANASPAPMSAEETTEMVRLGVIEVAKYKNLLLQYIK